MALESGFFNSVNGDRLYNAEQMSRYFENILSSGIFKRIENCLKVSANNSMELTVAPGGGLIDCHWFRALSAETVTITTAHAVLPRFDIVVARLDMSDSVRAISLDVVSGTPAESPAAPDPVRTTSIYDLVLALVYVPAAATAITEENLTDVRSNDWYCGYVHSLVDTPVQKALNSRYVASANDTTVAPINIAAYNPNADLLNVYVNGFRLMPGVEYTINTVTASITLAEPIDAGTIVDFEAIVPMMPEEGVPDLAEVVAELAQTVATLQADVATLETDTGWVDVPWADGVTHYSEEWRARIRRVGKTVYLEGAAYGVTEATKTLLTIPEGFRPAFSHGYVGYLGSTLTAQLVANVGGSLILRNTTAPSASNIISISTSWLVD